MQSLSCKITHETRDDDNIKYVTEAKEEMKCFQNVVLCQKRSTMLKEGQGFQTVQPHFPAALLSNTRAVSERGYLTQVSWTGLSFP